MESTITQCSTSRELHQLLLRHSGDLGGREVAAAIEVTARRRLLEPTPSAGGGSTGPLAPLLVQLADKYAPVMEPGSLSAAAWGLAALQLAPARPVVRQMQDLARRQLFRFAPSQLCTLLWAGSSLDPGGHSPLLPALAALIRGGMSLALFSSHNLAVLAYLCGQEGGRAATFSPAKDICIAVTDECRSRLQEYQQAERQAQAYQRAEQRARDEAAGLQRKRKPRAKSTEILPRLPPPPFTPGDAAMLLTGLAQLGLRVGGVVEPLVRQCKARLETAPANDVTRILVALGDLSMEIHSEPLTALLRRVCEVQADLSPQQVAAALWACHRLNGATQRSSANRLASMAVRHYTRHAEAYRTVDTISLLWGASQMQRTLPDGALVGALRAVQSELGQQSTSGVSSLLSALGRHAELRSAARAGWLEGTPAGRETLATASAVLAEVALRARHMQPAELAAAASALAISPRLVAALGAPDCEHAAVLRSACAAAAAANELLAFDVAQLATAAARLRWTDSDFLDSLAFAIECRARLGITTSEAVWALASLAPTRYPELFNYMAASYASKMQHPERLPAHLAAFQSEERAMVLSAFAIVAVVRGLRNNNMLAILASVNMMEVRMLPPAEAVPLLVLAAEARAAPGSAVVQACCSTIKRSYPRLGHDALRQVHGALSRLCPPNDPLVLTLERHMAVLSQVGEGNPGGEPGPKADPDS
ncbi:hypothetical protein ABPG77_000420 [Micractinium sp. CCAP 211/92]